MKLVLLPGLDGSGLLFKPLLASLGAGREVKVVNYNHCPYQTREALINHAIAATPKTGEFILVAESFSGPIAYSIGLQANKRLKGIIFVATFLSNPLPRLLKLHRLLPIGLYYRYQWPSRFVRSMQMKGNFAEELHQLFFQAVKDAGAYRLHQRLKCLADLPAPDTSLHLPCVYLQAESDALVGRRCQDDFKRWCKNLDCYSLPGSHFLLQAAPTECAAIITRELSRLGSAPK